MATTPPSPTECLLAPTYDRFLLKTSENRRSDVWDMYKKHQSVYWTAEEIDLAHDYSDFERMSKSEQHFVKHVLAFFAASDGIVCENIIDNMARAVQWPEARYFYNFQAMMENIHAETYNLLLRTLVRDKAELEHLTNAIETVPCVRKKAAWAMRWINDDGATFAQRLVAFAVVEGVFFSGAFCSIFWLKKRGVMPGLTFSNELISRDENLHCEFACLLFSKLRDRPSRDDILRIVTEAVECEEEFVSEALSVELLGMNAAQMIAYVRFVADRLLVSLGEAKHYHAQNPFDFMELQSLLGKTNFFERRVGEYQRTGSNGSREYAMDDDF